MARAERPGVHAGSALRAHTRNRLNGMNRFLWGMLTMACITASLLFVRYWRLSRDPLLRYFAAAFVAFALNWIALAVTDASGESLHRAFLFRLVAYGFIIYGIIDKNRRD